MIFFVILIFLGYGPPECDPVRWRYLQEAPFLKQIFALYEVARGLVMPRAEGEQPGSGAFVKLKPGFEDRIKKWTYKLHTNRLLAVNNSQRIQNYRKDKIIIHL
jgi:hypothetical protein